MGIEFTCAQCGKLLRTPDDSAGKRAKCPECGAVLPVPAMSETHYAAAPQSYAASQANPYQSPTMNVHEAAAAPGTITPTRITLEDVLTNTWAIYKRKLGPLIGVTVAAILISVFISWGMMAVMLLLGKDLPQAVNSIIVNLTSSLANTYMFTGVALYMLKTARGERAEFTDLFAVGPYFLKIVLAYLLYMLIVFVGTILFVIPGVIAGYMFSQYTFVILDQNAGVIDSLKLSSQITYGNKLTLFLLYLLVVGAGSLFTLLTCFVGGLFVAPLISLMLAVVYVMMTGQRLDNQPALTPALA